MDNRAADPQHHLTKQQDEQRPRGLRALARLSVRAHLAAGDGARGDTPGEEERHAE